MLLSTGLAVPCQHFWDGSKTSRKVELEPLVSRPWGVYGTQHHSAEGNWFWIHLKFLQRSTGTMRKLRLGFHLLACVTSTFVFSCSSQCRNTVRVTIRHSLTEASGYHHASSTDLFPILSLFSYPLPPSILLFNPRIQDPSIHPLVFDLCLWSFLRLWSCPTGCSSQAWSIQPLRASSKAEWLSPTAIVCCELLLTCLNSLSHFSTLSLLSQKSPPK